MKLLHDAHEYCDGAQRALLRLQTHIIARQERKCW